MNTIEVTSAPASMPRSVTRDVFTSIYRQGVTEVIALLPSDWTAFARHNAGWRKNSFDPAAYLDASVERYWRAYRVLQAAGARRVLDVGGFLAAFPLLLRRLGFDVSVAEKYDYYGGAMDRIAEHARSSGIEVIDADFTEHNTTVEGLAGRFDAALCMAVAEHLAHSPRALMENIRVVLCRGGTLVFEVPNIAFWPKRFSFFVRGATPLAPMADVFHSAIPFTGHHREYTLADARYVARESGFELVREQTFNYSVNSGNLLTLLKYAPAFLCKTWAELILLECRRPTSSA